MITIFEPIGTSHLELDKKEQIQLFSDWLKGLPHYSGVANSSVTLLFIIRKEISAFFSSDLFLSDKFLKNATKNANLSNKFQKVKRIQILLENDHDQHCGFPLEG